MPEPNESIWPELPPCEHEWIQVDGQTVCKHCGET